MGPWTYKIETNGDIKKVSDKELNIFQAGNDLIAFAPDYHTGTVAVYKSVIGGDGWSKIVDIDLYFLPSLQFCEIDGRIIGYAKAQLFEISFTESSYHITELDNEGLSSADITSVSMADEETVFITSVCNSFSDVCGGYFKPLKNFFDKKKVE
jgi:hypothetical protein